MLFASSLTFEEFMAGKYMEYTLLHQTTNNTAKKALLLLFVVLTGIMPLAGQTNGVMFRHFTTTDGLMNNEVKSVLRDRYGYLWIGTVSGLNRWDGYRLKTYENAEGRMGMLPEGDILGLQEDAEGNIWVEGRGATVVFVRERDSFVPAEEYLKDHPAPQKRNALRTSTPPPYDKEQPVVSYVDHSGMLWAYSTVSEQVYYYERGQWRTLTLPKTVSNVTNSVRGLQDDGTGNIWIATDHQGLYIYNKVTEQLVNLQHDPAQPSSLAENNIGCITIDNSGVLWVGYVKKGLSFHHPSFRRFTNHQSASCHNVSCIEEGRGGRLWIGTDGYGLTEATSGQHYHFPGGIAVTLLEDRQDRLWIGTYMNGLLCFEGGRMLKQYTRENSSLSDNSIYSLCEDREGRLWVGTLWGCLQCFNPTTGEWKDYSSTSTDESVAMDLFYEGGGDLYAGMLSGLCHINIVTGQRQQLFGNKHGKPFLQKDIQSVYRDRRGLMWLCHGQGVSVWDMQTDSIYYLNKRSGLCDNVTRGICEDRQGRIWIATSNGCSAITVVPNEQNRTLSFSFNNYSTSDGLLDNNLSRHSTILLRDGNLLVGSSEGYTKIDLTSEGDKAALASRVVFTGLHIGGQAEPVGKEFGGRVLLAKPIEECPRLALRYSDTQIEVEFSAMNLINTDKTRYAYRLEGQMTDWIETREGRIVLGSLPPGSYRLYVKTRTTDDEWSESAAIDIYVAPPFWLSWPAYIIYTLLLAIIVWGIWRYIGRRQQRRLEVQRTKMEQEQQLKMNEMKLRFFTNISHDFRTPLTLILTPLQVMLKETKDETLANRLRGIQRNADRLLALVNQLLDFRKLDVGGEKLNTQPGRFVYFITENAKAFNEFAKERNISYQILTETEEQTMMFDADKMLKVLTNLLSNAFKYTPDGGSISVSIGRSLPSRGRLEGTMQVSVADTGCGISDDDKPHIFERFYQTAQSYEKTGSGIGLHIVAEYVKMHDGDISVTDNHPNGSVFTFTIPVRPTPQPLPVREGAGVSLLIAEDNTEFRQFLADQLRDEYEVLAAENGREALRLLQQHDVDIVVSDVMMPEMDGVELCRQIKADIQTSHIPVLMLTALSADEDRLRGLEQGADDYLTKPFNLDVLRLRLKKFLQWSQNAHQNFQQKIDVSPSEITITSLDEQLIKKATKAVEDNMTNDYTVEDLASAVGLTRGHLYKKLMAITGKGPADFIRTIRLKRARQLLDESGMQIAEVAYAVGYSSPKVFSRNFKSEYGLPPTEYLKNKGENTSDTPN